MLVKACTARRQIDAYDDKRKENRSKMMKNPYTTKKDGPYNNEVAAIMSCKAAGSGGSGSGSASAQIRLAHLVDF